MPLVRVTLRKGKSEEFLREAGRAIHEALVIAGNAPEESLLQVFEELPSERIVAHPTYGGVNRSEDVMIIQITLNAGRSLEVKRALYGAIVQRLNDVVDVRPDDVAISLVEVPKENWSFGNGRATYAE